MLKRCLYLLLIAGLNPLSGDAQIVEVNTFREVVDYVDRDTMLFLDIDNTLLAPAQSLGMTKWGWNHVTRLEGQGYSREEAMHQTHILFDRIYELSPVCLVDEEIPQIIRELQSRKVTLFGLTGRDPFNAFVTSDQLQACGIDLTQSPLKKVGAIELATSKPSMFIEGILFTGMKVGKGETVLAFLKVLGERHAKPKIVMVDDRRTYLDDVARELARSEYDFVGIWYRGGEQQERTYRQDGADMQLRYLERILPDEVAEKILAKRR